MKRPSMLLLLIACFAPSLLPAGDDPAPSRVPPRRITADHFGDSPFNPPTRTDKLLVADRGFGLDTGCTYHFGGPLEIEIPNARVVGRTDVTGKLVNPAALVNGGFLSKTARITLPVFDIDLPGEIDKLYLNGHFVGQLTGANNRWVLNTFSVPVEWLRFGRDAAPLNAENTNHIRIDIDVNNDGWCMQVDWIMIEFDAIAPIFFVHGIAANGDTWSNSHIPEPIPAYLDTLGIPYEHQISLEPNAAPMENGPLLGTRLHALASRFGTRSCHLVVHSKGGNDSRDYLARHYDRSRLKVLSLYSLSSPFHGSVIAQIVELARAPGAANSPSGAIKTLILNDLVFLSPLTSAVPCCNGLRSLRPDDMYAFNTGTPFPSDVKFYNFASDADLDDDGRIIASENHVYPFDNYADAAYHILARARKVKVVQLLRFTPSGTLAYTPDSIEFDEAALVPDNDLAVNVASAQHANAIYLGQVDADHALIKSKQQMQGILSRIKADFPVEEP